MMNSWYNRSHQQLLFKEAIQSPIGNVIIRTGIIIPITITKYGHAGRLLVMDHVSTHMPYDTIILLHCGSYTEVRVVMWCYPHLL